MNNFSSAFKGKLIAGNNKYVNQQEKVATVIEANQADNRCVISAVNRDGISQVYYNVPVVFSTADDTLISWFPQNGEEVLVTEKNKTYVINGPYMKRPNVYTDYDYYTEGVDESSGSLW